MPSRQDGWSRISYGKWLELGGLANPRLCRVQRGQAWAYCERRDDLDRKWTRSRMLRETRLCEGYKR